MANIGEYAVAVDGNKPANFLVQNADKKAVMKLNSDFFIGVDDQTPSNFVVKNKDDEVLFQLDQKVDKNNLITRVGGYTLTIDGDNPAHLLIKNAEEREVMRLNPDYFIGVDDQTPSNFVIKNKVGEILFQLNPKKEPQPEVQRPYFRAYLSKGTPNLQGEHYFKPDKVLANIGNHYNPGNGIFTAPVEGLYQLSCKLQVILTLTGITMEVGDQKFPEMKTASASSNRRVTHTMLWSGIMKAHETAKCLVSSHNAVITGSETIPQSEFSGFLLT